MDNVAVPHPPLGQETAVPQPSAPVPPLDDESLTDLDKALADSFPASDPPTQP